MARIAHGWDRARLRWFLASLFLALAVPSAILVAQTLRQIKWESFHQYRQQAEALASGIDAELARIVAVEEARAYADYRFIVVAGDPNVSSALTRSTLAALPPPSELPGIVGYFQIDADGAFSTPVLPADPADAARFGIADAELEQRRALAAKLVDVLGANRLVERGRVAGRDAADAHASDLEQDKKNAVPAQAAFDQLNAAPQQQKALNVRNKLGRVSELKLGKGYTDANAQAQKDGATSYGQALVAPRAGRKEQSALLDVVSPTASRVSDAISRRVRIFESEVDPLEFALLESGHGVLYRKAWRNGQRTIQGAIVEQQAFVRGIAARAFAGSALAPMSDLVIAYQGDVLDVIRGAPGDYASLDSAAGLKGELLYQARLAAPFGDLQLLFNINRLPPGAGARIVAWSSAVLLAVLTLGFIALYRLGLRQIQLARQQHDFVSAVSHELKTPLTSIRMYAEMLAAGWAGEEKKQEYYRYIHDESERLSRLIANVLQLARLERNDPNLEIKPTSVATLVDVLRSKVHSQVEAAGFACRFEVDPACAPREVAVDTDAVVQILINLVDNALKFSARAERREVEIAVRPAGAEAVVIAVRDHGPGVPKSQMKKIFELFYRPGSELTRETLGTGIGLALVRQLARAMGGDVDVVNREPGAEFRVRLPSRAGP
jgi:signal transduction histidine kinase